MADDWSPWDCVYCGMRAPDGSNVCGTCWDEKTKGAKVMTFQEWLDSVKGEANG